MCENQGKQHKLREREREEKKQGEDDPKKTKDWPINKFQQKILYKKKKVFYVIYIIYLQDWIK